MLTFLQTLTTWALAISVSFLSPDYAHWVRILTSRPPAFGQPDRIGGTWQLRRFSSITVNGDESKVYRLAQKDTHKGTLLAATIRLPLRKGTNTLRIGGLSNGVDCKGADLDRVVVYPLP